MSNWLEVTDLDPRPSTTVTVQAAERKFIVLSSIDWKTEPIEYFHLFFDLDSLDLILL
jgi:hypothetical protein